MGEHNMAYEAVYRDETGSKVEIGFGRTIKAAIEDAMVTIRYEGLQVNEFWIHKVDCWMACRHIEVA